MCHPPVQMKRKNVKHKLAAIISISRLHRTVWGVSPASSDEKNLKRKLAAMISTSKLQRTVRGVSPASSDEKKLSARWPLWLVFLCYIELYEVFHRPVQMKKCSAQVSWLTSISVLHVTVVTGDTKCISRTCYSHVLCRNQKTDYAQLNKRAEISSLAGEKLNFYLWSYLMPEKLKFT